MRRASLRDTPQPRGSRTVWWVYVATVAGLLTIMGMLLAYQHGGHDVVDARRDRDVAQLTDAYRRLLLGRIGEVALRCRMQQGAWPQSTEHFTRLVASDLLPGWHVRVLNAASANEDFRFVLSTPEDHAGDDYCLSPEGDLHPASAPPAPLPSEGPEKARVLPNEKSVLP